jgi:hypothetical protein
MPLSGGILAKKLWNASNPPADAPIPTIKCEFDPRPAGRFSRLLVFRALLRALSDLRFFFDAIRNTPTKQGYWTGKIAGRQLNNAPDAI